MNHQDWNPVVIHGAKHSVSRPAHPHREVTKEQKLDQTELVRYMLFKLEL